MGGKLLDRTTVHLELGVCQCVEMTSMAQILAEENNDDDDDDETWEGARMA